MLPVGRLNVDRLERRTLVPIDFWQNSYLFKKEKIISFLVATNVVASRPPECRPTGTLHARAKMMSLTTDLFDTHSYLFSQRVTNKKNAAKRSRQHVGKRYWEYAQRRVCFINYQVPWPHSNINVKFCTSRLCMKMSSFLFVRAWALPRILYLSCGVPFPV